MKARFWASSLSVFALPPDPFHRSFTPSSVSNVCSNFSAPSRHKYVRNVLIECYQMPEHYFGMKYNVDAEMLSVIEKEDDKWKLSITAFPRLSFVMNWICSIWKFFSFCSSEGDRKLECRFREKNVSIRCRVPSCFLIGTDRKVSDTCFITVIKVTSPLFRELLAIYWDLIWKCL